MAQAFYFQELGMEPGPSILFSNCRNRGLPGHFISYKLPTTGKIKCPGRAPNTKKQALKINHIFIAAWPGGFLFAGGRGGSRRSQKEPGGARGSQGEPGAMGSQGEPGGARGSQEEPGYFGPPGDLLGSPGFFWVPYSDFYLHCFLNSRLKYDANGNARQNIWTTTLLEGGDPLKIIRRSLQKPSKSKEKAYKPPPPVCIDFKGIPPLAAPLKE